METSRIASAKVYGRSWFALIMGLNIRFRKLFRVLGAPSIRIDDIVAGRVELFSIWIGYQFPLVEFCCSYIQTLLLEGS